MKPQYLLTSLLTLALLAGSGSRVAAGDEAGPIQNRRGDASPTAAESRVNDYLYQDEQLNLGPDDEDVVVLRTDEKILLNRYVTATFPLHHVAPREIRNVFRELTAKEGGTAEVIVGPDGHGSYLQVVAPKWQVPYLRAAVENLDQPWVREIAGGAKRAYYRAQFRDIAVVDAFARLWGGEGASFLDPTNNAVVRRDEPFRVASYLEGAAAVDIPEHQGRFRVKVYEVATNNDLRLGLDYVAWKNGPGGNLFGIGSAGYYADQRSDDVSGILTPFLPRSVEGAVNGTERVFRSADRWIYSNFVVTAAYVDFLASKGKAKTLAEGSISVRSGDTGVFGAVDRVITFVVRPTNPGAEGQSGVPVTDPVSKKPAEHISVHNRTLDVEATANVGIEVTISPVILAEATELSVRAVVSAVAGMTPQGLPIIDSTETRTRVRVRDGSTLVLAGLSRTDGIESKAGVPWLATLPVLGWVFGGENNASREKQIVVVIESECETGGERHLADVEEIATIARQVSGEAPTPLPTNAFGFDQWLLGTGSGGRL